MKPVRYLGSSCQHKEIVVLIVLQIKRTFCAVNPQRRDELSFTWPMQGSGLVMVLLSID